MKNKAKNQIIVKGNNSLRLPYSRCEVQEITAQILNAFSIQESCLEIKLTDDREISLLNLAFLGISAPTNILSFPETNMEQNFLGSLVLSLEALTREIFLYSQDMDRYLAMLLAHGILHLQGYEHGETMDNLTELALAQLYKNG